MAACQSPAPGAECRVEKCPSSAPPWRAPAHTEPPLSRYPLLLLGRFSSPLTTAASPSRPHLLPVSLPVENSSVPNRRRRLCQFNGMCCMPQITHTCAALTSKPPLSLLRLPLYIRCTEPQSFMAHVCCDSVKGTGRKGRASSDAPAAVDQRR